MADVATKKTAAKKKVAAPAHPAYTNMIAAAVKALKDRKGSSRQAILKYIVANYKVGDPAKASARLRLALRKSVEKGAIVSVKGVGASGSFKLAGAAGGDAKPKKSPKKAAAKKPAAAKKSPKKPSAKKAKKPAAKKPVAKKSPAKKAAPKKSPAKKVAKKPAVKKAAKKPAKK